jgi:sec-independent protein translocase protein TatC
MEGQVNVIWVCSSGFILSFPYILWEIWKFISPAFTRMKRKCKGIFFSSLLFFIGVLFGYYIVIPMSVNFVATFKVSDLVLNQFTLDSYIGLVKRPFWQVVIF